MLGNHRWLRAGLLIMLSAVLGACSGRDPVPPEPLDLAQPIAVDQPGQGVSFEFEMNARNYIPHRTYAVELELQRQATRKPDEPDVGTMRIPFEVTLQQWGADAWKDVPTYDSYQAGHSTRESRFRNGMHPANGGIRRRTWAVTASTR